MDWIFFVTVLVVSIVAGGYGTLVGGSSLLTIPILILLGVPPHTAVASNRLGVMGITTSGLYKLNQKN